MVSCKVKSEDKGEVKGTEPWRLSVGKECQNGWHWQTPGRSSQGCGLPSPGSQTSDSHKSGECGSLERQPFPSGFLAMASKLRHSHP